MLQRIHERIQGWFAWIIIIIIGLAFSLWGIERFFGGGNTQSQTVAKLNGHKITQGQLNNTYERLRRELQMQTRSGFVITPSIEAKLKKQALEQLISTYLATQAALNSGFRIAPQQVDAVLQQIPAFQIKGQFSTARFQQMLSRLMFTQAGFVAQLRSDMLNNQIQLGFVATAFVSKQELQQAYALLQQKRDIGYFVIPAKRFVAALNITPQEKKAYYQQHQNQFKTPELARVDYIELSLKAIQANLKFTDTQLQQYYANNLANYTIPAKYHVAQILVKMLPSANPNDIKKAQQKINQAAAALKQGKSFSVVAKQYSEDLASKKDGGVIPWFNAGAIGPQFATAVAKLQPGEISPVVRTRYGFNIIKLLASKPKQVEPFSKVKSQVKQQLAAQEAQKRFANASEQLANLAFANPSSLKAAAQALNLTIKSTGLFSRHIDEKANHAKKNITSNPKFVQAAFNQDVLNGNNSDVIQLGPQKLVVLHIKQHKPATVKLFKDVSDAISQRLIQEKSQQKAKALGTKLIAKIKQGGHAETLAKQQGFIWQTAANIDRQDSKLKPEILQAAFALPPPKVGSPSVGGASLANGNYAIVDVTKVKKGNFATLDNNKRRALRAQLAKSYGQLEYILYLKHLHQAAKVEIYSR